MDSVKTILTAASAENFELALRTTELELSKSPESDIYLSLKVDIARRLNDRLLAVETAQKAVQVASLKTLKLFLNPALIYFKEPQLLNEAFVRVNRKYPKDVELAELWVRSMMQLGDLSSTQKALMAIHKITTEPRESSYRVCLIMALGTPNKVFPMLAERMLANHLPVENPHECYVAALVAKMSSTAKMCEYLQTDDVSKFIDGSLDIQLLLLNGLLEIKDYENLFKYSKSQLQKIDSYNYWEAINSAAIELNKIEEVVEFQQSMEGSNVSLAQVDLAFKLKDKDEQKLETALSSYWSKYSNKASTFTYLKPYVTTETLEKLEIEGNKNTDLGTLVNIYKFKFSLNLQLDVNELIEVYNSHLNEVPEEVNDYFIGTDLLLLAATIILEGKEEFSRENAAALLEYALIRDPKNFFTKVKLLEIYYTLGSFNEAKILYENLSIRNVQTESLGYLISSRIGTCAPAMSQSLSLSLSKNVKPATRFGIYCFHTLAFGVYTQFGGTFELGKKLNYSLSTSLQRLEEISGTRINRGTMNVSALDSTPRPFSSLVDNRDFETPSWCGSNVIYRKQPIQKQKYVELQVKKNLAIHKASKKPHSKVLASMVENLTADASNSDEFTAIEKWQINVVECLLTCPEGTSASQINLPSLPPAPEGLDWEFYHYCNVLRETMKIGKDLNKKVGKLNDVVRSLVSEKLSYTGDYTTKVRNSYKFQVGDISKLMERTINEHKKQLNALLK